MGRLIACVEMLSGLCGEAVWRVWEGCLDDLGRLSGGEGKLSRGCGEVI